MLILQPQNSLAVVLVDQLLKTPPFQSFHFAAAWARLGGVELINPGLKAFPGHTVGVIGVNARNTSYEALFGLFERLNELWVFYKHPRQTFHPKIYLFSPNVEENLRAVVIVGSSNLTTGGLVTNFEAVWYQELNPREPKDSTSIIQLQNYFIELMDSVYCHRVEDVEFLVTLLRGRYISTERRLRLSSRRLTHLSNQRARETILPTAPPPPVSRGSLIVVPDPLIDEMEEAEEVIDEIGIQEVERYDTLFYVRTLTPNDVSKAHRVTPGTWEPDLGLEARDEHPEFWGWPDKYETIHSERVEWRTLAVYHSRIMPEGVVSELCLWYRPERPGHPAEHRFRPDSHIRGSIVPPDFDVDSIMIVQRLPESSDAEFRVDFVTTRDPEHQDYSQYLTITKPRHRRGYGSITDLED